jgi:hypothetical protein
MHIDKIKNKYSATMFWPAWFSNLLANDWWAHSQPSTLRELCIMTSHSKYTKLFFSPDTNEFVSGGPLRRP